MPSYADTIDHALDRATTTRAVVVRPGALADLDALLARHGAGRLPVILADETTWAIAGERVHTALRSPVPPVLFPPGPRPDLAHVATIVAALPPNALPVAVGSGTLNDLAKRAAHQAGAPCWVVATAASMDGYTASGAALIADGVKRTFACAAPEVVVADLDLLRTAPTAMTAAGYGDLIGKVTAGADWILADALGIEPILPDVWAMVQGPLRETLADPKRYRSGDPTALGDLFAALVVTGLAIQAAGNTRCASGSEHQFSHLWEMRGLEHRGSPVSHGLKVGLGTVVATALYEALLDGDLDRLDIDAAVARWPDLDGLEAEVRAHHDHPAVVALALGECRAKWLPPNVLRDRLATLRSRWPEVAPRLRDQLLPLDHLTDLLRRAGCPTTPGRIGLTDAQLRESHLAAGHVRRRYTVFDAARETGALPGIVDALFAPGGHWHRGAYMRPLLRVAPTIHPNPV